MDKAILQKLIDKNISQRDIAKETNLSQSTVRYWLKKYNLKTNKNINNIVIENFLEKECGTCKKVLKLDEFYKHSNTGKCKKSCKNCENYKASELRREKKIKMVVYKGGKCEKCKLKLQDTHPAVFEFHHIDPNEKDKSFVKIKNWSWNKIKKELDKCMLLCANCHRIEHNE